MADGNLSLALARHAAMRARADSGAGLVAHVSRQVGIPDPLVSGDDVSISVLQEAAFVQGLCEEIGDIDLGFRAGLAYGVAGNLPAYIARHAPTVRKAMDLAFRYDAFVRPGLDLVLKELGNIASVRLEVSDPRLQNYPRHLECYFSTLIGMGRAFMNRAFYPDILSFTHIREPVGTDVRARLGCPVSFGGERSEFLMPLQTLDAPMIARDDILEGFLVTQAEAQLATFQRPAPGVAEKVELAIQASFPEVVPTTDSVAKHLGMSRRSLSRHLREAGTSFQDILNQVRLRLAVRFLRDSNLQIGEIGYRLGYSSRSAFTTAFRRETGFRPREFRDSSTPR